MENRQIIVYSQPFWGSCDALAEYLTGKGVTFVRKDLMIDEEAREELFSLGVRSAPALVVEGEVVTGFDRTRIDALLGLWSRPSAAALRRSVHNPSSSIPTACFGFSPSGKGRIVKISKILTVLNDKGDPWLKIP
jgi:glutaredoxin